MSVNDLKPGQRFKRESYSPMEDEAVYIKLANNSAGFNAINTSFWGPVIIRSDNKIYLVEES